MTRPSRDPPRLPPTGPTETAPSPTTGPTGAEPRGPSSARASTARSTSSPAGLAAEMRGTTWHPGCPVPLDGLRLLHFNYWGFGGNVLAGRWS